MRRLISLLVLIHALEGAVILDRIAVIVGKHVIKISDIERDVRLTDFLNRQPLEFSAEQKRKSAERLIDQEIIRQEIITGGYRRAAESDAAKLEADVVRDRFHGSEAQFHEALARYGLTGDQLRAQLLWQLTVLQFIDERFRVGVFVSDDEIRAYYDQHQAELRRENPKDSSFAALQAKIRSSLEGEQVNQNFNAWLEESRKRYRIEYKQEAFT